MSFFPHDTTKYRPAKLILRADLLREADRAVQEGLGDYNNRHELVNDAIEQLLVELRYGADDQLALLPKGKEDRPAGPRAPEAAGASANGATPQTSAEEASVAPPVEGLDEIVPITDIAETAIVAPTTRGVSIANEVANVRDVPQLGLHNRDAPSLFALAILAHRAKDSPVPMRAFYEDATAEAWRLAAALEPWECEHGQKVTVMLPRNRAKPQTAAEGFEFFGIGQVNKRPDDDGRLAVFGPFYLWRVAGLVRQGGELMIGMTDAGWDLLEALDGLTFGLPHDEQRARRFLAHLHTHAAADLWGFREVLAAIAGNVGRNDLREHFRSRLAGDYPTGKAYTESMSESTAQGYLARARAWGLVLPGLFEHRYGLTDFGKAMLDDINQGSLPAPAAV